LHHGEQKLERTDLVAADRIFPFCHNASSATARVSAAEAAASGVGRAPRLRARSRSLILCVNRFGSGIMSVATDYIRHAARLARKCAGDPFGGPPQPPDPEFYKTLAKALEEIAAGLDQVAKKE
jgi:hypothetical protein